MVISWVDFISGKITIPRPVSATIGVFDGVHRGHIKLIDSILNREGTDSTVITFSINPRIILKDYSFPGSISTLDQKIQILQDLGVDDIIVIDFSPDFSRLTGEQFLRLLVEHCTLEYLVLGENFRFGYLGKTTPEIAKSILAQELIHVEICPMAYYEGSIVSSTRIRKTIIEGRLMETRKMLNRVFSLDIATVPLIFREETIIIDKNRIHQVLPPQGQYDVSIRDTSGEEINTGCVIDDSYIRVNSGKRSIRSYTVIQFNSDTL